MATWQLSGLMDSWSRQKSFKQSSSVESHLDFGNGPDELAVHNKVEQSHLNNADEGARW